MFGWIVKEVSIEKSKGEGPEVLCPSSWMWLEYRGNEE